ncbi:MAG: ankyrin repeat domain-containing protein, partial [Spirochaetes bacterium]|nr:ankyrin repeat domain-containing protein [Spirochaetota bacterium]
MYTDNRNAVCVICIALSALLLFVMCGCGGMKYKIVNTGREVSTGYQSGNTVYFLCHYVLSQPGKTIIPMYMYSPGEVYVQQLLFYEYTIPNESLVKISELDFPHGPDVSPDLASAQWLYQGNVLYVMFPAGWNGKDRDYQIYKFNVNDNTFLDITDNEKLTIVQKLQQDKKSKTNVLTTSQVLYYVDCLPLKAWDVPSPLMYCSLSKNQLIQTFIEGSGDSYFKEEAFGKLKALCSSKELMAIATDIEKHYHSLDSYQKMQYAPYKDRWVTRLYLEYCYGAQSTCNDGKLGKAIYSKNNDNAKQLIAQTTDINFKDKNGTTALMIAAYADNAEIVSLLLSRNCDINAQDNLGCSALMYAVFANAVHTMELLLKYNANVTVESSSHYTAWMYINNAGMRQRYL